MNYTMKTGYMDRVLQTVTKVYDVKGSQNPDTLFLKKMAALSENAKTGDSVDISTSDLSMEEYKQCIYDKISQLPIHPTNMQDSISVQISDAGLEAMKNDSEYEQWVLDSVRSNLSARDPWSSMCGGKYVILYYGAEKEESRGESWRGGYMNGSGNKLFQQKSKNGFWERRIQRQKELADQYEEMLEIKELNKDLDKGLYYGSLEILNAFKAGQVKMAEE